MTKHAGEKQKVILLILPSQGHEHTALELQMYQLDLSSPDTCNTSVITNK